MIVRVLVICKLRVDLLFKFKVKYLCGVNVGIFFVV